MGTFTNQKKVFIHTNPSVREWPPTTCWQSHTSLALFTAPLNIWLTELRSGRSFSCSSFFPDFPTESSSSFCFLRFRCEIDIDNEWETLKLIHIFHIFRTLWSCISLSSFLVGVSSWYLRTKLSFLSLSLNILFLKVLRTADFANILETLIELVSWKYNASPLKISFLGFYDVEKN